ncbi:MAG: hypothetical protein OYL41_03865, partial [Acidobacteriota bacterium]|nr:hypothetical protein [Acidobacteriota bacterium]
LVFAAAFSVQTGFGAVIDQFRGDGPEATFAGAGFAAAFLIAAGLQGLSLAWLRLTRPWRTGRRAGTSVVPER